MMPLLRSLVHWLAYALFQFALVLAYLLHSAAALQSPFRASEELHSSPRTRRIQPQPRLWSSPVTG
ncbi:hypothetical protein BXP70_20750 [Hymenobacter crusticola]|uniref:Uncharacterized protein n=2 Tax=Hymenobacter crusticola TaxID=1770526 RepID=A0A243W998_9BACT|nr:hypothetical protein BXP70_20750 [Hymenobacter crusticola]